MRRVIRYTEFALFVFSCFTSDVNPKFSGDCNCIHTIGVRLVELEHCGARFVVLKHSLYCEVSDCDITPGRTSPSLRAGIVLDL